LSDNIVVLFTIFIQILSLYRKIHQEMLQVILR